MSTILPSSKVTSHEPRVQRIIDYFESLTPESVEQLHEYYRSDAYFKDPFNEVTNSQAIHKIFKHMYVAVREPRFVIKQAIYEADECFLTWDFLFYMRRFDTQTEQCIRGCSHLKLTADGKIYHHRDYWDAAEELYEKLPGLGILMRWLKKQSHID